MLSKGFVEAHLRMYLDSHEKYLTRLYSSYGKECPISSFWHINQILNFLDCLIPGFYLNVFALDYSIDIYSDCIKVYDCYGRLLNEYREE